MMATIDPRVTSLQTALSQRREIEFKLGGAAVTLKPHILYVNRDGVLKIAGTMGDIPVAYVQVDQIHDLIVSPRYFQPDPAFDFANSEYYNPIVTLATDAP